MAVWSQNAPSIRPLPSSHGLHTVVGGPGALTAIYSNTVLLEYHLYTSYICVKIGIFTLDIGYPDPKLHHQRGHRSSLTFLDIPGASVAASTNQQAAERNPYQLKSGEMEISAQPRYTARSIFSPEKKTLIKLKDRSSKNMHAQKLAEHWHSTRNPKNKLHGLPNPCFAAAML